MKLSLAGDLAQLFSLPVAFLLWAATRRIAARFWKRWAGLVLGTTAVVTLVGMWRLRLVHLLAGRLRIPAWLLLALGLWAVVLWLIIHTLNRSRTSRRDWRDYVSDEILGAVWHWRYIRNEVQNDDLSPFCPTRHCRCRLEPRSDPERRSPNLEAVPVALVCPHCGFRRELSSDLEQLKREVVAEIERRIDTGEYQKRLERDS